MFLLFVQGALTLLRLHAGPFYMTLAGPSDAFPDLSNSANKHLLAAAVHSALNLDSAYPVSNMILWVQEIAFDSANSARRRRLSDAAAATQLLVLGYSLMKHPKLPPKMQLQTIMADPAATERLAQKLADSGFLPIEDLGRLSVGLTSWGDSSALVQHLTTSVGQGAGNIHLSPIGKQAAGTNTVSCFYSDKRLRQGFAAVVNITTAC